MKKSILALSFAVAIHTWLFASTASASGNCGADRCIGNAHEIVSIVYPIWGHVKIGMKHPKRTSLRCTLESKSYVRLNKDHPNFEEYYSMLLVAMSTNAYLNIRVDDNSNPCELFYMRMENK